ncbi:hypothetical protein [Pseudomonas aeruginosa]|uniref:hypothetical protein n=1 Tax=Pseudomonas aeruginosa TaxID=287 RepID=UPI0032E4321A
MTNANECTCPSGGGSLRHPCPAHPESVELAGVAAKLTFINGRPAMCGCQVEYSSGGGEYSDVIYVTLCAKHSGSAILDLVATNRIALTPEYEGQWHADFYLDREIPLAKAEGATPAEAVLALMSAERIDPEQESVEQAGGDERAAFFKHLIGRHPAHETEIVRVLEHNYAAWKAWQARAALAQPSPVSEPLIYACKSLAQITSSDGSGHADIALAILRMAGVCDDERERLVNEWKAARAWKPSPAQAEQAEAERPEEFSFEYRHPNGECHTVTVSREQVINEMPDFLFEALCSKFCNCEPVGETNVVECCCDEYAEEFKLIAAAPGTEVPQAWLDVQAERRRQITAEGWTPDHDDLYCAAELPRAAAAYILSGANDEAPAIWPFVAKWWKPRDARANYVRAGALILAEIERLDRAAAPGKEGV